MPAQNRAHTRAHTSARVTVPKRLSMRLEGSASNGRRHAERGTRLCCGCGCVFIRLCTKALASQYDTPASHCVAHSSLGKVVASRAIVASSRACFKLMNFSMTVRAPAGAWSGTCRASRTRRAGNRTGPLGGVAKIGRGIVASNLYIRYTIFMSTWEIWLVCRHTQSTTVSNAVIANETAIAAL
eukprot:6173050-Pleurochrysis_carterae.AAC.2